MKTILSVILFFISLLTAAQNKIPFNLYFLDQTLRIDYFHTGNAKSEEITTDKLYAEGSWAGNPENCIQPFELGIYKVSVEDLEYKRLIYSKGYTTLFAEYQTTEAALSGIKRTFHESVLIPYPKRPFRLIIEKRDRYNKLSPLFIKVIDPSDYSIIKQKAGFSNDVVVPMVRNGDPHNKVDIVILAEGYQAEEIHKFKIDLENYSRIFYSVEPYKSRASQFNIQGIFAPSEESGTDEPRQHIFKSTRFGSTFNYFDLDRYCLADDNKNIRDAAAKVPYDIIVVMVNRERYGGGGIYNWQTVFTARSEKSDYVFLHEFGHAFAGLADEYFSSPVTYVDFYTEGVEPLEANITSLPDKNNVKWKTYLSPGISVPTDWGKATYDSLVNLRTQSYIEGEKKISELRKSGASEQSLEIAREDIRKKINFISQRIDDFYENHPLKDKVGVFEGANYMSEGMYRPTLMSLMHGFEKTLSYDVVNEQEIIKMIKYYTGE
ncbi:MAG: hypothetical protein EHM20_15620 [Alphaproteobacteria bacterium]|nr:MAG: hypothetical protein EHM20_15620 [Alphaproteobacteria bacterium]